MNACKNNNIKNVKLLLKYKADINIKNNDGKTALMIASENNFTDIVTLLSKNVKSRSINDLLTQIETKISLIENMLIIHN